MNGRMVEWEQLTGAQLNCQTEEGSETYMQIYFEARKYAYIARSRSLGL